MQGGHHAGASCRDNTPVSGPVSPNPGTLINPKNWLCRSHVRPDVEGPMPSEGEEYIYIQAGSPSHTTLPICWSLPADVMRVHCRALSRECHCRSLRRPATSGARWVASCRASQPPQSIIGALLIPHNHWTIVIMIYRVIGTDSM